MKRKIWFVSLIVLIFSSSHGFSETQDDNRKLIGFSQIRTVYNEDKFNFSINKVRLILGGDITSNLLYSFVGEGGDVAPNGSQTFSLLDAYLEYKVSDLINIRVGQDWYKFGWEYTQSVPTLPFINFSETISKLCDTMGRKGYYGYDIGIWMNGSRNLVSSFLIGYNFSLTNGTGLNSSDDNQWKDLSVRFYSRFFDHYHIGFSIFRGESSFGDEGLNECLYDIEIRYLRDRFTLGFEYIGEKLEESEDSPLEYPEVVENGYYVYASYNLIDDLDVLLRYDTNTGIINEQVNDEKIYTIGTTYWIKDLTNLKANYIRKYYDDLNEDLLLVQIQMFFK